MAEHKERHSVDSQEGQPAEEFFYVMNKIDDCGDKVLGRCMLFMNILVSSVTNEIFSKLFFLFVSSIILCRPNRRTIIFLPLK